MGNKRIHATEKPVELYLEIIKNSTTEGQCILDPYAGSGASAIAALELNRDFIGFDVDAEYCRRIEERIAAWKEAHPII
jgi:DNA modification methylase